jgi:hypothetical protein
MITITIEAHKQTTATGKRAHRQQDHTPSLSYATYNRLQMIETRYHNHEQHLKATFIRLYVFCY